MTRMLIVKLALLFAVSPAFAAKYIIKLKDGNYSPMAITTMDGVSTLEAHEVGRLMKVDIEESSLISTLQKIKEVNQVEYIVKDFPLQAFRTPPSVTALKDQWAIAKVGAEKAWNLAKSRGSKNVIVAVIDTGVDYNHESLRDNSVPGYDFRDNDSDPMDDTSNRNPGHGTHCAGIVGATGLVDGGIVGLSPEVSIMPLRFLGADGSGDLMAGIKAIDHAIAKGAKVISASWGATVSRSQAKPLIEAVKRASDAGVIFVAAAANDGKNNDKTEVFPANAKFENTITVAASGSADEKPSWSNYGQAMVDVSAPGLNIMSTLPKNKYGNLSGTSMATPLVSGLVALLASQNPDITGAQVRSLMQVTGAKVQIETACNCRVDAGSAMEALLNETMVVVPAAWTLSKGETLQFDAFNGKAPFKFSSSNAATASISAEGLLTANADGETVISITDANGKSASSLSIHVGAKKGGGGGGGGGDPGQPGQCPIGDPQLCEILCQIMPDAPFCNQ